MCSYQYSVHTSDTTCVGVLEVYCAQYDIKNVHLMRHVLCTSFSTKFLPFYVETGQISRLEYYVTHTREYMTCTAIIAVQPRDVLA